MSRLSYQILRYASTFFLRRHDTNCCVPKITILYIRKIPIPVWQRYFCQVAMIPIPLCHPIVFFSTSDVSFFPLQQEEGEVTHYWDVRVPYCTHGGNSHTRGQWWVATGLAMQTDAVGGEFHAGRPDKGAGEEMRGEDAVSMFPIYQWHSRWKAINGILQCMCASVFFSFINDIPFGRRRLIVFWNVWHAYLTV